MDPEESSTDAGWDAQAGQAVLGQVCALADRAAAAQAELAQTDGETRRELLEVLADTLVAGAVEITQANAADIDEAFASGMDQGLLDRLRYDQERVAASAQAIRQVAAQPDPLGQVVRGHQMPNGMRLEQIRVPLGVVAVIYEARPNVSVDVAALCIKSGNAVLLRGGHAAARTNRAIVELLGRGLESQGFRPDLVSSVDRFGRAGARALMSARGHIDLLVPRGGRALIASIVEHAKVPTIETGAGNVHIYVDRSADLDQAVPIIMNAKTQRVGVCNAAEKLIIHRDVARDFLPRIARALTQAGVELRMDAVSRDLLERVPGASVLPQQLLRPAGPDDWDREYLALRMGVKVVDSIEEAIDHINAHSTGHTEAILAQDYAAVTSFSSRIDSAVVMVNASTRFTDGGEFGMGAELGISTQKLHARGPMGLRELTTTKWIGYGTGQVRV
ncbi:glutamate-5-semialdehyde dehydrogenase [Bifidobacterium xylocopae]|uniref:Gamma-glutamyl phosphate reductase n=1 Tax=Bifidobacterium xylocopae TaxID=2493119 RepID=A0A366KCQ1_9BIFI|nr:glutamate-5-semialdehyde dehydrogenase [Bifidobacterium xylocopae]RBP99516.1 glutamate-5-semialdehyde dehydrogenase [Bifidobacterium xylocopae]